MNGTGESVSWAAVYRRKQQCRYSHNIQIEVFWVILNFFHQKQCKIKIKMAGNHLAF